MSFKKSKYTIIRKAISKDLATFIYNYFSMRKQVYDTFLETKYISPFENAFGFYEQQHEQIPNTFCCYGDNVMDTLLLKCQATMEKATGLKLYPAYTYARLYKQGDELKRHKDRFSCEISTTLNLGGDKWPIYLSPFENVGLQEAEGGKKGITASSNAKGVKVDLEAGDMLVYRGIELEHWRKKFKGNECCQVFLHYNNTKTKNAKKNIFDSRKHLGLPNWFKRW